MAAGSAGVVQLGMDGLVLAVDERLCEITGLEPEELVGRPAEALWAAGAPVDLAGALARVTRTGVAIFRTRLRARAGTTIGVQVEARLLHAPRGGATAILQVRDVEYRVAAPVDLPEGEGMHPGVCALAEGLWRMLPMAIGDGQHLSLVLLDLEGGAPAGEEAARVLAPRVRASEVLACVGPDTVAWLVRDAAGVSARAAAERLRRALAERGRAVAVWAGTVMRGGRPGPLYPVAAAWRQAADSRRADRVNARRLVADLVRRGRLSDDQADALVLRLGLDGGPVLSVAAVSDALGLAAAEVRRLVADAVAQVARDERPGPLPVPAGS
jgi:PAS domain S-box-containing protein